MDKGWMRGGKGSRINGWVWYEMFAEDKKLRPEK